MDGRSGAPRSSTAAADPSSALVPRPQIGNAYTAGMADDLSLSSSQYQNLLTLF